MAEQMDAAVFCFPPKFLTDEEIVMEKEKLNNKNSGKNNTELLVSSYAFPNEFPYEFASALNSPVDSVVESTKTKSSDEDEFLAGLNSRLASSKTQKLTVPSFSWDKSEKTGVLGSSPQSTLSELGSWSASSNGSPNGAQNDTWGLIYAAASQVAKLKMSNESHKFTNFNHGTILHKTQNHSFMNNTSSGFYSSQSLSYNQSRTRQMGANNWKEQQLKVQQINCSCGSCMRPVLNGGSKFVKRESAGTGVFIPRTYSNNPHVSHKKPGCSTVIVPTKVVQALHMNFDDSHYDALVARRNALLRQTRVNYRQGSLNLPQEWTY